jgi:hypothetical protein
VQSRLATTAVAPVAAAILGTDLSRVPADDHEPPAALLELRPERAQRTREEPPAVGARPAAAKDLRIHHEQRHDRVAGLEAWRRAG